MEERRQEEEERTVILGLFGAADGEETTLVVLVRGQCNNVQGNEPHMDQGQKEAYGDDDVGGL